MARWIAAPNSRFCCGKNKQVEHLRMPNSIHAEQHSISALHRSSSASAGLDLFIFSATEPRIRAAIQRAINEWQLAYWSDRDPRLKASILAGQDDTEAAIARSIVAQKSAAICRSMSVRAPTSRSDAALLADLRARAGA